MTRPASSVLTALLLLMSACSPAGERVGLGGGFSGVLVDEAATVHWVSGDDGAGVELAGEGFEGGTFASPYDSAAAPAGFREDRHRRFGLYEARLYRRGSIKDGRELHWAVTTPRYPRNAVHVADFRCTGTGCRTVIVLFKTLTGPPLGAVRTAPSAPPPPAPRPRLSAAGAR